MQMWDYYTKLIYRCENDLSTPGFHVNWADAPRPYKVLNLEEYPLICSLDRTKGAFNPDIVLVQIMQALEVSYGLLNRRLDINSNDSIITHSDVKRARWGRGSASGGARYPICIYLYIPKGFGIPQGLFFYSPIHSGLQLVNAAWKLHASGNPEYLTMFITYKIWQNTFKYNNFTFEVMPTDVGTFMETFMLSCNESHIPLLIRRHYGRGWMDQSRDFSEPFLYELRLKKELYHRSYEPAASAMPNLLPSFAENELSTSVSFTNNKILMDCMQQLNNSVDTTSFAALSPSSDLPLGAVRNLRNVICRRVTSYGRFDMNIPFSVGDLMDLLSLTDDCLPEHWDTGLPSGSAAESVTKEVNISVNVLVCNAVGIDRGVYRYDPLEKKLIFVTKLSDTDVERLQKAYLLDNYQLSAIPLVVVPTWCSVSSKLSVESFLACNFALGAWCQAIHLSASAMKLGFGAALGFNPRILQEMLKCQSQDLPLLLGFIGHNAKAEASYHYELVKGIADA